MVCQHVFSSWIRLWTVSSLCTTVPTPLSYQEKSGRGRGGKGCTQDKYCKVPCMIMTLGRRGICDNWQGDQKTKEGWCCFDSCWFRVSRKKSKLALFLESKIITIILTIIHNNYRIVIVIIYWKFGPQTFQKFITKCCG